MNVIRGELIKLSSLRLVLWTVLLAAACGALLTDALAFIGPENATPPMPGLDTADGVAIVLGLPTVMLFVPALIGTIAVTSEYRHRTIGTTFLAVPRRGRVLGAKLVVYTLLGLTYGIVCSVASGAALFAGAAARGVSIPVPIGEIVLPLIQLALAAAVYMVLGVSIGALARSQLIAIAIVLGYFYLLEFVLMMIPGVNAVYPFLPGGATASLTSFSFLTDAMAEQTSLGSASLASPAMGAVILLAYAGVAGLVAVIVPLRRDLR
ncbi:ABC transporter permease [Microbacterium alcoholitolerans]|uniref:ABC transporter permease n=1 Tax=unclassified Microbacterium TaxID=2609290 RepID=UPI003D169242